MILLLIIFHTAGKHKYFRYNRNNGLKTSNSYGNKPNIEKNVEKWRIKVWKSLYIIHETSWTIEYNADERDKLSLMVSYPFATQDTVYNSLR